MKEWVVEPRPRALYQRKLIASWNHCKQPEGSVFSIKHSEGALFCISVRHTRRLYSTSPAWLLSPLLKAVLVAIDGCALFVCPKSSPPRHALYLASV
jgi:hypothetical protein